MDNSQSTPPRHTSASVDRRAFLRLAGAATIGFSFLLEACAPGGLPTLPGAAAPTAKPSSATGAMVGKIQLPTYVPGEGLKPDLAPNDAGLQAGYLTYPKERVKSVQRTPGLGGEVTAIASLIGAPPTPLDQNPAWQEINRQLNVNMKLQAVAQADYPTRTATIMAGGDLPDLFYIASVTAGVPQFLEGELRRPDTASQRRRHQGLPEPGGIPDVRVAAVRV